MSYQKSTTAVINLLLGDAALVSILGTDDGGVAAVGTQLPYNQALPAVAVRRVGGAPMRLANQRGTGEEFDRGMFQIDVYASWHGNDDARTPDWDAVWNVAQKLLDAIDQPAQEVSSGERIQCVNIVTFRENHEDPADRARMIIEAEFMIWGL